MVACRTKLMGVFFCVFFRLSFWEEIFGVQTSGKFTSSIAIIYITKIDHELLARLIDADSKC